MGNHCLGVTVLAQRFDPHYEFCVKEQRRLSEKLSTPVLSAYRSRPAALGWLPVLGGRAPCSLLLDFELELHLPLVGIVGVVKCYMIGQDLAHDEDLRVSGNVEKFYSDQRVAVVGLEQCGKTGGSES